MPLHPAYTDRFPLLEGLESGVPVYRSMAAAAAAAAAGNTYVKRRQGGQA